MMPFRMSRRIMRFEAIRTLMVKSLKQFKAPIKSIVYLRNFNWFKVLWIIATETVFTFTFAVISYFVLLLIGGLWAYLCQNELTRLSIVFSYFPFTELLGSFRETEVYTTINTIYDDNIRDLIFQPNKILNKWEIFTSFVKNFFIITSFKLIVTTFHEWTNVIEMFTHDVLPNLSMSDKLGSLYYLSAAYFAKIEAYVIGPTLELIWAIIKIPWGFDSLFQSNYVGEIVWIFSIYVTWFNSCWFALWGREEVTKTYKMLREWLVDANGGLTPSGLYPFPDEIISMDDSEFLKYVDGESYKADKISQVDKPDLNKLDTESPDNETVFDSEGEESDAETVKGDDTKGNVRVQNTPVEKPETNLPGKSGTITTPVETPEPQPGVKRSTSPIETTATDAENAFRQGSSGSGQHKNLSSSEGSSGSSEGSSEGSSSGSSESSDSSSVMRAELRSYFRSPTASPIDTAPSAEDILRRVTVPIDSLTGESSRPAFEARFNPLLDENTLVHKNGHDYKYTTVFENREVYKFPFETWKVTPDRAQGIEGVTTWKYYLATNSTIISIVCFTTTMITGYAIKSAISLTVNTAVNLLA